MAIGRLSSCDEAAGEEYCCVAYEFGIKAPLLLPAKCREAAP